MFSLNGVYFKGLFQITLRNGLGFEETTETYYEGFFKDNVKSGKGKLIYKKTNDTYEGDFSDNAITGFGKYHWNNNDTYEGTFVNGKMEGKGHYKWPDGGEYYGEYRNNIKEGLGKFKWPNGKIFEGPFCNGKPNGKGKLIVNNYYYSVEFCDGQLVKSKEKYSASKMSTTIDYKINNNLSKLS